MKEFSQILRRHCTAASTATAVPQLTLMKVERASEPTSVTYGPLFCMLATGRKRVWLGKSHFIYGPGDFLITSAEMPLVSQIIEGPYYGFAFALEAKRIAEILLELPPVNMSRLPVRAVSVAKADDALSDAALRLLRLLDSPARIPFMLPLLEREILYLLLQSVHAETIRQLGAPSSPLAQVQRGIAWIRAHFVETFPIQRVAQAAGMSVPTLNRHFRAVTNLSPLQFQKRLRLQEARRLLLAEHGDAASVGFEVGYESPSHFSRDYRRMFGAPPQREIAETRRRVAGNLRQADVAARKSRVTRSVA